MTTVPLTMRYGTRPQRETLAWLIPGSAPSSWLEEVAGWDVAHQSIRLLPLPRESEQRQAAGVLALVSQGPPPTRVSPLCVPYGVIAQRLYLPIEAELAPQVSDEELCGLLSSSYTYVWHPVTGLAAFEPTDELALVDLLQPGPRRPQVWDRALPGIAISRQLIALAPEQTLSIEMILGAGQDDIGTSSDALGELPPSPLEPKPGLLNASAREGKRWLAQLVGYLARQVPANSSTPTWIDALENWSRQQLEQRNAELNAQRNQEIVRLLHLLETDPTSGLRFAIPLSSVDAHRGLSRPHGRLVERATDFNLGRLGGGQSADYWDVSWEYQLQLTQRYRELANREIQLGRHRRAAYIFAELLGDFEAAAGALADGSHWREAAVLYQRRLHRPLDAARCLEQGGLWTEAVALYEEVEEYEKAGDILHRIEQFEAARLQYIKAVDQHRSQDDLVSAASLLETKLDQADAAIAELASGWPDSRQAIQCLNALFKLLGRLGRHAETLQWVQRFRDDPLPSHSRIKLANIMADTATDYPDRSIQEAAADCTRVMVSRQLSQASNSSCRQLLAAVRRLAPEDLLLGRDCLRYVDARPVPVVPPRSRTDRRAPQLIHTLLLSGQDVVWKAAAYSGDMIFVAGSISEHLFMLRCNWTEVDRPGKNWRIEPRLAEAPIILAADPYRADSVLVHVLGGPLLSRECVFQPTDRCPTLTRAGALRGTSPGLLAAVRSTAGINWGLEWRNDDLTLCALGPAGQPVFTQIVPVTNFSPGFELFDVPVPPFQLYERNETVYVGVEQQLFLWENAKSFEVIEFDQRIRSVVGSVPKTRTRIAVTLEQGGVIYWDDIRNGHTERFARDMPRPLACLNKGGFLIVVSQVGCEVYQTQGQRLDLVAELGEMESQPVAVIPGTRANQFGIVMKSGTIEIYEVPT